MIYILNPRKRIVTFKVKTLASCAYVYVHLCVYMCFFLYVCVCVFVCVCMCACVDVPLFLSMHMLMNVCGRKQTAFIVIPQIPPALFLKTSSILLKITLQFLPHL